MAEPKTKRTGASVGAFLASITDPERRRDACAVLALLRRVTGERPAMWGASIVGFGTYRYRYASGQEADWPLTGFSPRAQGLTLYFMAGFAGHGALLRRLGRHSTGKACLYLRRLEDVDEAVLEEIVRLGVVAARALDRPREVREVTERRPGTKGRGRAGRGARPEGTSRRQDVASRGGKTHGT